MATKTSNGTVHRWRGLGSTSVRLATTMVAVVLTATSCSSSGSSPTTVRSTSTSGTTSADTATDTPTSTAVSPVAGPAALLESIAIGLAGQDGTKLSVRLALTHALKPLDPTVAATWATVSSGMPLPCPSDPSRDTVFIGSVNVTNNTPGFSADLALPMGTVADGNLHLGTASAGGTPSCTSLMSGPGLTAAGLSLDLSEGSWGPSQSSSCCTTTTAPRIRMATRQPSRTRTSRYCRRASTACSRSHRPRQSSP